MWGDSFALQLRPGSSLCLKNGYAQDDGGSSVTGESGDDRAVRAGVCGGDAAFLSHTLFMGPDGLRPGWGLAFYWLMFLTLQRLGVDLAASYDLGDSGLWNILLEELATLIAAVVPGVVLARVEHRAWGVYGLPGRGVLGNVSGWARRGDLLESAC